MARLRERRRAGKAKARRARGKRADRRLQRDHHSHWWQRGQQLLFATKSEWGPGPWQHEPDRLEWRHASGLPCLIVRNGMGSLCGYVGVPPEHPFYMRHYDQCEVHVHGGLTFSRHCSGEICHKPEPGEERDIWWLGFDCAHYRDLMPAMRTLSAVRLFASLNRSDETYKPIAYVQPEVERLAEQVKEAGNGDR
jgi:hypothetical protein